MDQTALFDIAWTIFEDGHGQKPYEDMVSSLAGLISELSASQIYSLLGRIQQTLEGESPKSVRFALLLHFKRLAIDAVIHQWPLRKLQPCLSTFHPMECVYMLLNSTFSLNSDDAEAIADLFAGNTGKAYRVFNYILLWMNWKVFDPLKCDDKFYETYFNDYSREERKRVMSGIGSQILQFIQSDPGPETLATIVESLSETVPLLEGDHLVLFWSFFAKIQQQSQTLTLGDLYRHLSCKQLVSVLTYRNNASYLSLGASPGSTTSRRYSVISDIVGWDQMCVQVLAFIASRYDQGVDTGDATVRDASVYLQVASLPANIQEHDILPIDKVIAASHSPHKCILHLLQSRLVTPGDKIQLTLRSCVLHWALFEPLRHIGTKALLHLGPLSDTPHLVLHSSGNKSVCFSDSVQLWIAELGTGNVFYDCLSDFVGSTGENMAFKKHFHPLKSFEELYPKKPKTSTNDR